MGNCDRLLGVKLIIIDYQINLLPIDPTGAINLFDQHLN